MAKQRQQQSGSEQEESGADGKSVQRVRSPYPPGFNPVTKARQLHRAMDRIGTDERAIFDALQTGRSDLNRAIETAFNRMYSRSLRSWLRSELSGSDRTKAFQLLGRGDFSLAQKLHQAADGWGTDENKIFYALEKASASELAEVKRDASLMYRLRKELNDDDYALAMAFFSGHGVLAAKLRRSVAGWGTDESAIWRAIDKASEAERKFVLRQPSLMKHLRSDLGDGDYLRARRVLAGTWDNADKIEVAMAGWGTDEAQLVAALGGLNAAEFNKLALGQGRVTSIGALQARLESELSGDKEYEALAILHQKRIAFDQAYRARFLEKQKAALGEAALQDPGAAALVAGDGESMSTVGRLKLACRGWGTDDESIWDVCASIPPAQGQFILQYNPENVVGALRRDLSIDNYFKVRVALGGGAMGRIMVLRNAVEGLGTNEGQVYDALESILAEGLAHEVLRDRRIMGQIRNDLDPRMYTVFVNALQCGEFTPKARLTWATARYGTDEELVWEVCELYGSVWYVGGAVNSDVDALLDSELSTRDYWKALDLIRGEPQTEQEKLARSKEMLERERSGGVSPALMDTFSDSGQNADEAWREYQATYNRAHEDGEISEAEEKLLRRDEEHSKFTTTEYREAKASIAQWASQIAITIVGIVATFLTAGAAAGPFLAALSANAGTICTSMVLGAAMKVGIHKAIEGEGYDLGSMDALVDGVGAAIEVGLFSVGNIASIKMMQGIGKTGVARSIAPAVEKSFGGAGKRILGGGLENAIDGTIGGVGEGLFRGLANDKAWSGNMGQFFSTVGTSTALNASIGTGAGFAGGALFKSIGETFGPSLRKIMPGPAQPGGEVAGGAGKGSVDDILAKMPDDLQQSATDQARLLQAVDQTNQRMQGIANEVSDDLGIGRITTGVKGNKFGAKGADLNQEKFIDSIMEKTGRWGDPEKIGAVRDSSRGRFDVDSFDQVEQVQAKLRSKLEQRFGAGNVDVKPPRDVYKRYHIIAKDPATGLSHEFQVGTRALTTFVEKVKVDLPSGVKLHGANFHVVMYDVLAKLDDVAVRTKHGLDDGITARIGLDSVRARYDQLMIEAGSVAKGKTMPDNFHVRLKGLSEDLGRVVRKLEAEQPGLATKLDTKLGPAKAADATPAPSPTKGAEVTQAEAMPEMPLTPKGGSETVKTTGPQPKVRPDHEGAQFDEYINARAFLSDGKVDPYSAKQGSLGDCYLLAGCAAEARANPEGLKKLFKDNGDGTFDVTLYIREGYTGKPTAKTVTVDSAMPSRGGNPLYAKVGRSSDGEDEMWMALLEKALATHTGSYDKISGGNIGKAINFGSVHELLTGNQAKYIYTSSLDEDTLIRRIADALDNNEPIYAGSHAMKGDETMEAAARQLNIYGNHAYSIEKVDLDAKTVDLQNPWGRAHPRSVSIEDFQKYYKSVQIGKSAPAAKPSAGGGLQPEGGGVSTAVGRGLGAEMGLGLVRSAQRVGEVTTRYARLTADAVKFDAAKLQQNGQIAEALGIQGGKSEAYGVAMTEHLNDPTTIALEQTDEHGQAVVFFLNPLTGVVVITDPYGDCLNVDRLSGDEILAVTGAI